MSEYPTHLPGQVAAPTGPADLTTMYAFHFGFRRDLNDFNAAATRTPPDDRRAWQALVRRWDLFSVILEDHHNNEDLLVWPLLRERCAAAGDAAVTVLDETEAEHDAIDVLLPTVRDALTACAGGLAAAVPRVQPLLEEARAVISAHLAHEEWDALRLLQRHLSAMEWDDLQSQFRSGVRLPVLLKIAPWLLKDLPTTVASQLSESGGAGLRLVVRLGSWSFHRLDRAAFRHAHVALGR